MSLRLMLVTVVILVLSAADATAAPLLAERFTWAGFVDYWSNYVKGDNQVFQVVAIIAAVALGIVLMAGKKRR